MLNFNENKVTFNHILYQLDAFYTFYAQLSDFWQCLSLHFSSIEAPLDPNLKHCFGK
jgi:hypothetical protein